MKTLINENSKSSSNKLSHPQGIEDMFLYRINRLRAKGGGVVLRYCEGEFGITRREWVILAILSTEEVLNSSALASRAELTPPATSKAVSSLLTKGLLERNVNPQNRTVARIKISKSGKDVHEQILPIVISINKYLLESISKDEIELLDSILERMQQQANKLDMRGLPLANRRNGSLRFRS
jgi:DNA-binding MarR family transcriptional regulator